VKYETLTPALASSTPTINASVDIRYLTEKWVYIECSGTWTSTTVHVEVSHDDTTFHQVGSDVTDVGMLEVPQSAAYLRLRTSAYNAGSGTLAARVTARNARLDW